MIDTVNREYKDPLLLGNSHEFDFTKNDVAACPFCLSSRPRAYEIDANVWAVCCVQCQAVGPHADSKEDAIGRWKCAEI